MSIFSFFLIVLLTCLLWTAACTAAAVRLKKPLLRRLLLTLGFLAPLLSLLPFVAFTTILAFVAHLQVNWFPLAISIFISTIIGSGLILLRGTQPDGGGWKTVPAANWSPLALFTLFLLTKSVTAGTILYLNQTVAAKAQALQNEAAILMTTHLPLNLPDQENAEGLYRGASVIFEDDDDAFQEIVQKSSKMRTDSVDPEAIAFLTRYKDTLDLLRQAATRPVCRFTRDYSRPSVDMHLPEMQFFRNAARILAVSAHYQASVGNMPAALRDVSSIMKMSLHASSEPILISGLIGLSIDGIAVDVLIDILPFIDTDALSLLKRDDIHNFLFTPPSLAKNIYGEESFGLNVFSIFGTGEFDQWQLASLFLDTLNVPDSIYQQNVFLNPALAAYRIFLFPQDLAAYRQTMHSYQRVSESSDSYAAKQTILKKIEDDLSSGRPKGFITALVTPAIGKAIENVEKARMRHTTALVAIAATEFRIAHGSLPEKADSLVPDFLPCLPKDTFHATSRVRYSSKDDGVAIYSVGPNGKDDGGPGPEMDNGQPKTDDVGIFLRQAPPV
ncbi:MAG: hypothetical protein P8J43_03440 [Pirellulales bacterium]|nr:hypothetical protein [Pirellulales bacterium]